MHTCFHAQLEQKILNGIYKIYHFRKSYKSNLISDCVPPFNVDVYTDSTIGVAATQIQRGICLEYEQRPC